MLPLTSCPDSPSLPLRRISQALTPCRTRTILACALSAHAVPYHPPALSLPLAWASWLSLSFIPVIGVSELIPQLDRPVSGGLPLTHDDFRTHCVPLPSPHIVVYINHSWMVSFDNTRISYAVRDRDNATRSPRTRRIRSLTTILADYTRSRPDYRAAVQGGFSASAASAPPRLRPSPPSRSARLGIMTLDRRALLCLTLMPSEPMSGSLPHVAPWHPTPHDIDTAAAHLSDALLSCSHHDWEQERCDDPLYDEACRYLQLDRPKSLLPPPFATTSPHINDPTPQTYSILLPKATYSRATVLYYLTVSHHRRAFLTDLLSMIPSVSMCPC